MAFIKVAGEKLVRRPCLTLTDPESLGSIAGGASEQRETAGCDKSAPTRQTDGGAEIMFVFCHQDKRSRGDRTACTVIYPQTRQLAFFFRGLH